VQGDQRLREVAGRVDLAPADLGADQLGRGPGERGMIFFLLSIPLMKGRWKPSDARQDEQEHEAMVAAELAKLNA
jgi:hypothetical protein